MRLGQLVAAALSVGLASACQSSAMPPTATPSPVGGLVNSSPLCRGVPLLASRQRKDVAVFTWHRVGDGYRPAPTGLTGSHAVSAVMERPQFDASHNYAVLLTCTGADADLLRQVTQTASTVAHAANPVAPDGFIGIFLGLTDSDIATWDAVQATVMKPVAQGGKLISNPVAFESVTSGQLMIFVGGDLQTGCSLTAVG